MGHAAKIHPTAKLGTSCGLNVCCAILAMAEKHPMYFSLQVCLESVGPLIAGGGNGELSNFIMPKWYITPPHPKLNS